MISNGYTKCPYHPNAHLIEAYSEGDLVCSECGLVVSERFIDIGNEWRNFTEENPYDENPLRVGPAENLLLDNCGLGTIIGPCRGASDFDELDMQRYYNQRMSGKDKSVTRAIAQINEMTDRINATKRVANVACKLFKQVADNVGLRGRKHAAISSASLYIACRQEGVPRTLKEISAVVPVPKKQIGRYFKMIMSKLPIKLVEIKCEEFLPRFCRCLGLPITVERVAITIARNAVNRNLVNGRSPISVAVAAIYMATKASEYRKTEEEVCEIADVAVVTLRQSYNDMIPCEKFLFQHRQRY